jgi:hypothetical protein
MCIARTAPLTFVLLPLLALAACTEESATPKPTAPVAQQSEGNGMASQEVAPIVAVPLTGRHTFTDDVAVQIRDKPDQRPTEVVNVNDATHLAVLEITIQPGARFPWHTHPGPVAAAVTQGELVYVYADDCVRRHYPQTAFIDPGFDNVHMAFNPSSTEETVIIATFFGVPAEGPLTIPVSPAESEALDDRCGLAPASAHGH